MADLMESEANDFCKIALEAQLTVVPQTPVAPLQTRVEAIQTQVGLLQIQVEELQIQVGVLLILVHLLIRVGARRIQVEGVQPVERRILIVGLRRMVQIPVVVQPTQLEGMEVRPRPQMEVHRVAPKL